VRNPVTSILNSVLAATAILAIFPVASPARAADKMTEERLLNSDRETGNWLQHHKNYSTTRFSDLKEINKDNVKNLKVTWTLHLGGVEGGGMWTHGGLEGTPIVENGVIYVTDGWGSVYKIDGHGGKGTLLWKMDPKTDHDWAGAVVCCGVDNRGVALWGNLVISHTVDGRLIATNKETDQLEWQRQVADPDKGETITGAPLILKNMAITGVAGAELGVRGWVAAMLADARIAVLEAVQPKRASPGEEDMRWSVPTIIEVRSLWRSINMYCLGQRNSTAGRRRAKLIYGERSAGSICLR
jgi:alcohol dehydrogenase (cytochrome c)